MSRGPIGELTVSVNAMPCSCSLAGTTNIKNIETVGYAEPKLGDHDPTAEVRQSNCGKDLPLEGN